MMSELTLQQVSYRYPGGSRYALDGISGTFSAGKLYAVIGPSGSGKSTLLSLMAGLDRPTEGSLQLNGSDYRSLNLDRCRRQEIAMIFQAFQLFPLLTVLENVCFPMEANGVKQKEAKAKAKELLTSVGISEEQHQRYPANLSGGEQQRVILARALAQQTPCLILDEPTNHLDIKYQLEMMDLVRGLGRTVITAVHDLNIAALYCDTLVALKEGQVVGSGPPQQLLTPTFIRKVYEVEAQVFRDSAGFLRIFYQPGYWKELTP